MQQNPLNKRTPCKHVTSWRDTIEAALTPVGEREKGPDMWVVGIYYYDTGIYAERVSCH